MKADPASPIDLTFSEPVKMGECLTTGYCKISLKPYNSAYGYYYLDATEVSSEVVVAGMSVRLKPRSFLKANANYTVEIEEGAFEGEKTAEVIKKTVDIKRRNLLGPSSWRRKPLSVPVRGSDVEVAFLFGGQQHRFQTPTRDVNYTPPTNKNTQYCKLSTFAELLVSDRCTDFQHREGFPDARVRRPQLVQLLPVLHA